MQRYYYAKPLAAVKAANKFEAKGLVVELSTDGDVFVVTVYQLEEQRHVA